MATANQSFDHLKERMRASWIAGDFGQIAKFSAQEAADFVGRLPIQPGMRVLDVACGTGNLAIPAARLGAVVTGLDLAPNLIEQARARAAAGNLIATFDEGDAEHMPYAEHTFDLVMSMYGAMFAPRPERVVAEFVRVCRPGGKVAMANWTPQGFVGRMFKMSAKFVPPPEGIPAPVLWGDEATVQARLGPVSSDLSMKRQNIVFDYPFPPAGVVAHFREYFGPTKVAFSRLDADGQAAYAAALEALWSEFNEAGEGRTTMRAEYLEVVATLK